MCAYDVFLSHRSCDKSIVEAVARRLEDEAGIRPFLDKWHLVPGTDLQENIEQALKNSASFAVFIGREGVSGWVEPEVRAMIEARIKEKSLRIIPVFIDGCAEGGFDQLPPLLKQFLAVDFRGGLTDNESFERLVAGITGKAPGRDGVDCLSSASLFLKKNTKRLFSHYMGRDFKTIDFDISASIDSIARRLNARSGKNIDDLGRQLRSARALVYDAKYAERQKNEDERYLDFARWESELRKLICAYSHKPVAELEVACIGIGNGNECPEVYKEFRRIIGVDISSKSLQKAAEKMQFLTTMQMEAEDLAALQNKSIDLYLSLRTFQSSFFHIERAAIEATRVLRDRSLAIVSVPNLYITSGSVATGAQTGATGTLDKNKPWQTIERIRQEFTQCGFSCIIQTGFSEIFLIASQ